MSFLHGICAIAAHSLALLHGMLHRMHHRVLHKMLHNTAGVPILVEICDSAA